MKRFITLTLALVLSISMCLSLSSCKKDSNKGTQDSKNAVTQTELTEQDVRILMEKNLDCYFLFYVSPIKCTTQQNSDGYYGTEQSYFKTYDELKDLVESTYTEKKATELLNYPSEDLTLYKNVDGLIFEYPASIKPVEYKVIWDDSYTVEMEKVSDKKYKLHFITTDLDSKSYETDGEIVFENGKWRFADLIY